MSKVPSGKGSFGDESASPDDLMNPNKTVSNETALKLETKFKDSLAAAVLEAAGLKWYEFDIENFISLVGSCDLNYVCKKINIFKLDEGGRSGRRVGGKKKSNPQPAEVIIEQLEKERQLVESVLSVLGADILALDVDAFRLALFEWTNGQEGLRDKVIRAADDAAVAHTPSRPQIADLAARELFAHLDERELREQPGEQEVYRGRHAAFMGGTASYDVEGVNNDIGAAGAPDPEKRQGQRVKPEGVVANGTQAALLGAGMLPSDKKPEKEEKGQVTQAALQSAGTFPSDKMPEKKEEAYGVSSVEGVALSAKEVVEPESADKVPVEDIELGNASAEVEFAPDDVFETAPPEQTNNPELEVYLARLAEENTYPVDEVYDNSAAALYDEQSLFDKQRTDDDRQDFEEHESDIVSATQDDTAPDQEAVEPEFRRVDDNNDDTFGQPPLIRTLADTKAQQRTNTINKINRKMG